jgi:cytoskeletal protein CcmA (bactofilin family)
MFGKNMAKMGSFVGPQSEFQGELEVRGTLRMDGSFRGRVQAEEIIVSEGALIKGDVLAKRIIVGGRIEGSIRAPELVEIKSKGKVKGDIFTNNFSVMEGGEFNGKIEMGAKKAGISEFESKTATAGRAIALP